MKLSSIAATAALLITGVASHPDVTHGVPSHVYRRMDLKAPLVGRQDTGRCGVEGNGAICPGQSCCSMYGYCESQFQTYPPLLPLQQTLTP